MGRLLTAAVLAVLAASWAVAAQADTRMKAMGEFGVTTAGRYDSYLDGGIGKLRFGRGDQGLRLFGGYLQVENDFGERWDSVITLDVNDQLDHPVGFTEAVLRFRPMPRAGMRFRGKLGLFRPPISLEHSADGWATRYTIQASALNSWVGEELGAYGFEASVKNDRATGTQFDWGVKAALFYGNDPAGTMLAWRGWSPNNVQTRPGDKIPFADLPFFDIIQAQASSLGEPSPTSSASWVSSAPIHSSTTKRLEHSKSAATVGYRGDHPDDPDVPNDPNDPNYIEPPTGPGDEDPFDLAFFDIVQAQAPWAEPYLEIDNRYGYYVAVDLGVPQRFMLRLMHYDNRADPEIFKHGQYAWRTYFNSAGFQSGLPFGLGLIVQYMSGRSYMGQKWGDQRGVDLDFDAKFVLLTKVVGDNRFSVRREWFSIDDNDGRTIDPNGESLRSWTLSYQRKLSPKWRLALEWLEVKGRRDARELLGLKRYAAEDALYATLRWAH